MKPVVPARPLRVAIVLAALAGGGVVIALQLASDHKDPKVVWAIFGPAVGWSFIATGLYAWRHRPESRIGALMVLLGFAWFLSTFDAANSRLVYTFALVVAGLWGSVFLHIGVSFPTGRLTDSMALRLAIIGYFVFPLAPVPALLFAGPHELGCDDCPTNLLLIRRDGDLATALTALSALAYLALFSVVLAWAVRRWQRTHPIERLQLTPVYIFSLLTFALVTVARAGAGDAALWPAFIATLLTPFAFLGGLLRSRLVTLDAELRASLEELRASRARIVAASDHTRRQIERDLHDGVQQRLVSLALGLRAASSGIPERLDEVEEELGQVATGLGGVLDDLREISRGIHPAILAEGGLGPALKTLARRSAVPVDLDVRVDGRLPERFEVATYYSVSEVLTNVAKHSQASVVHVEVEARDGTLHVSVRDDGVGGADPAGGSGLVGLRDRVEALGGALSLRSPRGEGTALEIALPLRGSG
jgi:signal transduction histidine kinase